MSQWTEFLHAHKGKGYTKTQLAAMYAKTKSNASSKVSRKAPKKASSKAPKKASSKAPKKASSKVQKKASSKVQKKASSKVQKKASSKVQKKASGKMPKKASSKVQKKASGKVPKKAPSKVPKKAPSKVPKKAPSKASKKAPSKVPKKASSIVESQMEIPSAATENKLAHVSVGKIEYSKKDIYTFRTLLGSGSFGSVWFARNSIGEGVVIKIFNVMGGMLSNASAELHVLNHIDKYVCYMYSTCVLDYYAINGFPRIVMSYVRGDTLTQYISKTPILLRSNYKITKPLIMGMNAFHSLGVAHNDIKSANIVLDTLGHARYIDWGLGCLQKYCCDTLNCGASGTAYTMPPEISFIFKNKVTFEGTIAHDIWSLGVVLLDLYTLEENPEKYYYGGTGEGGLRIDRAIRYLTDDKLEERLSKIDDPDVKKIVALMLTKNVEKRLENWSDIIKLTLAMQIHFKKVITKI